MACPFHFVVGEVRVRLAVRTGAASPARSGVRIVQLLAKERHEAGGRLGVAAHGCLFVPPGSRDPLDPVGVVGPLPQGAPPAPSRRSFNGALHLQDFQHGFQPALPDVHLAEDLVKRLGGGCLFEQGDDRLGLRLRRERGLDEVVLDLAVFASHQQDSLRLGEIAAGSAHLLIVGDGRPGTLVVDDEPQVGLVVAHAQRRGRHHDLDGIGGEGLFDLEPLGTGRLTAVGTCVDATPA